MKSNGLFYVFERDCDKPMPTVRVVELRKGEIKECERKLRSNMFNDIDSILQEADGEDVGKVFGEEFNTDMFSEDYLGDLLVAFVRYSCDVEPLNIN